MHPPKNEVFGAEKFLKFETNLSTQGAEYYNLNRLIHQPIQQTKRFWSIEQFPTASHQPSALDTESKWQLSKLEISQTNAQHQLTDRYRIDTATWNPSNQQWLFNGVTHHQFNTNKNQAQSQSLEQAHLIKTTKHNSLTTNWQETPRTLIQASLTPIEMTIPLLTEKLKSAKTTEKPQLKTLLTQRIFDPLGCLASCLLAISLGLNFERKNSGKNTLIAISLMVAMLLSSHLGYSLGAAAILPAWLASLMTPLIFSGIGLWILRKQLGWIN